MRLPRYLVLSLLLFSSVSFAQDMDGEEDLPEIPISDDYILQPLDLLQMRVFQEENMDREVRISRESTVMLPLIGLVDLAGLTIRQAEEKVTYLYDKDYLVNPQINITVLEYARRTVNVLGAVAEPGEIEFPQEEGLSLMEAISRAGGFTRLGDRRKVRLTRREASGDVVNFIVNTDDMIEGDSAEEWPLQTGDLIFVQERIL